MAFFFIVLLNFIILIKLIWVVSMRKELRRLKLENKQLREELNFYWPGSTVTINYKKSNEQTRKT